ncbi:MAG: hypothetical protein NQ127_02765 [Candidatus Cardinium sp.]|nr:hypothetical protein [Candidatus Cardinium sp.]
MKITKNLYIAWVMVLPLLTGCGKTDDEYLIEKAYIHDYPEKSASKGTVYIATPYNQNACDSHKALLQGYVLIGKANFTSYPVAPSACIKFGKKVGAENAD